MKTKVTFDTHLTCQKCASHANSVFQDLDADNLQQISDNKSCAPFRKGQILFHEGTRPLGVYCLNRGTVKVFKTGFDGKEQIVSIAKPGVLLGYKALLSEELYSVSSETLEDCAVCFIPKGEFLNVLDHSNSLNRRLLRMVCREYGVMADMLTNISQRPVRTRLAVTLLMLRDTYGQDGHEDGPVEINLTREDLANIIGTATETLIRLLSDFKEEGLITTKGRRINIAQVPGLVRIANAS